MTESLHAFSSQYFIYFLVLHILGTVLGLGGATIADMFFFRFLKDFRISKAEADIMQWMAKVVIGGLMLIYLSGFFLFWSNPVGYLHSGPFMFKMTIVFIVSVNGILLHEYVSPHLRHISFLKIHPRVFSSVHQLRRIAFAMGAVSVTSWYTAFLTAMLKSVLPDGIAYLHLMTGYVLILLCAIGVSQIMEWHLHRRGSLIE